MAVYLITYDLNTPGKNYDELYEKIKSLGAWAHYLDSTWFVDTSLTSSKIRDRLKESIDNNDSLFVIKMTADYAGWLNKKAWEWLKKHLD